MSGSNWPVIIGLLQMALALSLVFIWSIRTNRIMTQEERNRLVYIYYLLWFLFQWILIIVFLLTPYTPGPIDEMFPGTTPHPLNIVAVSVFTTIAGTIVYVVGIVMINRDRKYVPV
ncbi:MAG: hypothetical protein ACW98U_09050 [Candidatus Thorarchaeota archaeon]